MNKLKVPALIAAVSAALALVLLINPFWNASGQSKTGDEAAIATKADFRDATRGFPFATVTREPWRSFNPLSQPSIGGEEEEAEERGEEGGFEGNADERLEWFLSQRMYPFTSIPDGARLRAFRDRKPNVAYRTAAGEPLAWRAIGPRPTKSDFPGNWGDTSGRINAVAVSPADPNLILIGAATGGVWRSTDGGVNFTPVSDSQADLAVGSIAFSPSNPQIVYAGMGDAGGGYLGSGLLRSNDAGATWTRVSGPTLPSPGTISRIIVDPTNPNRVSVAQYLSRTGSSLFSSGFFYSIDGGVTFTKTWVGLPRDLVQHPTNPDILYMSAVRFDGGTPNTGGVWRSNDRGSTWNRIYTATFPTVLLNVKIAVTPAAPDSLYVLSAGGPSGSVTGSVQVTPDGGSTWSTRGAAFDTGQFSYNCYFFVHPANPETFYVGTRDLWRTTDGGTTFTNITNNFSITGAYNPTVARAHPDQHHFFISPGNPSVFYISNDGGVYRTTDGGNTFSSLNGTLGLTMFTSLAMHPTAALRVYGGTQDNGNQRRNPSGTGWEEFQSGDGGQINVDVLDPSILYVSYVNLTVWRFSNHGSTFQATIGNGNAFNNDRVAFYPPIVGNGTNSNVYFGTYRLYMSTNRGASWTAPGGTADLTNGGGATLSAIEVSKSNNDVIYTGASDGRVMVSTNGGTNWTPAGTGLPTRFVKSITIDPTNPAIAYATFSGFLTGHVYKTVNTGQTWVSISGNLPDIPVNTLLLDPRPGATNSIFVGTDIGVFYTTNGGLTWESFNNGMPPAIVSELAGHANGTIVAATYGRGAYEINLNGIRPTLFDYESDRKADLSVYRPSDNVWYILRATAGFTAQQFGVAGDKLAPADYDGDGKTDVAVFRPSNGTWYMYMSGTGTFQTFGWGQNGDVPVPTDRDADGKTDLVIFRPSNNTWYTRFADGTFNTFEFGTAGDKPVVGDFDGDGRGDVALFRPSNNNWYLLKSSLGFFVQTWGEAGDQPITGDFDGDGSTDQAVFRPGTGQWFLSRTSQGFTSQNWGQAGDIPAAADYDGDGKTDIAVFRPANATWFIVQSRDGILVQQFGQSGDVPTQSAFNY